MNETLCLPIAAENNEANEDPAVHRTFRANEKFKFDQLKPRTSPVNFLQVVNGQLWSKLVDQFPSLRKCSELERFTEDSLKIAWALTIQNPRYVIEYDASEFREDRQVRFHSSDPGSKVIRAHLWPALLEQTTGFCVCKAVVIT